MAKNTDTTRSPIIDSNTSFEQKSELQTNRLLIGLVSKQNEEISKLKDKFTKDIKKIKADEIEPLKASLSEELKDLKSRSDRTIETIGIFAALLSFVTFEAQIFKSDLNGFTLIGLSGLLLGALMFFVFALSNAFNPIKRDNWKAYCHPLITLPAILVIVGGFGAYYGYTEDMKKRGIVIELKEEVSTLKFNLTASSSEMDERILELENKSEELISDDGDTELDIFKECVQNRGLVKCL
jgi:hypothetical protein